MINTSKAFAIFFPQISESLTDAQKGKIIIAESSSCEELDRLVDKSMRIGDYSLHGDKQWWPPRVPGKIKLQDSF